ncbi:aminoglycoside 6-adenylyltransferase [Hydrogenispora ethanolica]|jgi:aminoglycoside 6-adenylyltransferase|uniref:Aminoglycoside 6-adenylyltransferase n=1 Tax=Hydrogenispora ethanolica TaxID=1082276 RepID=A0A4R1RUD6_HYDET|nr:aminoglycoside 6-adenylyltransferase [Hydrogenispora ethanolica]TCL70019.1 aminoglycoside 6-adenylyltransferase [Hydrogenispora ethanolica]
MRSEAEMMGLILRVAGADERIRAVALNGSRANPRAPRDLLQDYDIVYLVTEVEPFTQDPGWVDVFGERIIMQTPDTMTLMPSDSDGRFHYLMQFRDGNRIDLTLIPLSQREAYCREDSLTVILLDKDGSLPELPAPDDTAYRIKPPSPVQFADCCNEFWWIAVYVAKGLWRREILYAKEHLDGYLRPMLRLMLEWQAGIATGFTVSAGKCGKYLERYLPGESWRALLATYAGAGYAETWEALFTACGLFRRTAREVAGHFGYAYPEAEDERVSAYLRRIRELPRGAVSPD